MSSIYRRGPLDHRSEIVASDGAARLSAAPFHGKLVLRGDPGAVGEAVAAACGIGLPPTPCTATHGADIAVLWIGPDEHWIVTGPDRAPALAADLEARLKETHHQVVDVSDYYTAIALSGPSARAMLMKLTTLDLDQSAFAEGDVAGSMFAHAQAYLWQRPAAPDETGPSFVLFVRRTMADYLWCLIAEAGREFAMPAQEPLAGETWRLER